MSLHKEIQTNTKSNGPCYVVRSYQFNSSSKNNGVKYVAVVILVPSPALMPHKIVEA